MTPRDHAANLYNQALPLIPTDPRLAYQMLISSVTADPTFAAGWSLLGAACADLGQLSASVEAYRSALRLSDGEGRGAMTPALRHRCLLQLGHRLTHQTIVSWDGLREAQNALFTALAMEGDFDAQERAFCHTNLSLIAAHRGAPIAEIKEAELGFEMHPDPATELGLAFACLFRGRYERGIRHFEARFPHQLGSYLSLPYPRWTGEPVNTLTVLCEQGMGDSLSFSRFIPGAAARVERLVFPVQPVLVRILAEALAHLPNVQVVPQDRILDHADAWCPIFSLPTALGLTDESIRVAPGLPFRVTPVEDRSWKQRDARLHVAIAWAGNPGNGIDYHRSIPFHHFLALRAVPGIALYSVQVGDRGKELHDSGCSAMVRDLTPWIRDARDTAGILGEMDAVVCCESFVGHLAGALDVPCLLMVSLYGRDWRSSPYLGDAALWYPRHRVLRQHPNMDWARAFDRAARYLAEPIAKPTGGLGSYITPIKFPRELSMETSDE